MKSTEITFLAALVQLMHGECSYVRTANIRQVDGNRTIWSAPVAVFQLLDHPTATECFAWCNDDELGTPQPVVYLESAMINSPAAAVRAYATGLCQEMAA